AAVRGVAGAVRVAHGGFRLRSGAAGGGRTLALGPRGGRFRRGRLPPRRPPLGVGGLRPPPRPRPGGSRPPPPFDPPPPLQRGRPAGRPRRPAAACAILASPGAIPPAGGGVLTTESATPAPSLFP